MGGERTGQHILRRGREGMEVEGRGGEERGGVGREGEGRVERDNCSTLSCISSLESVRDYPINNETSTFQHF